MNHEDADAKLQNSFPQKMGQLDAANIHLLVKYGVTIEKYFRYAIFVLFLSLTPLPLQTYIHVMCFGLGVYFSYKAYKAEKNLLVDLKKIHAEQTRTILDTLSSLNDEINELQKENNKTHH